MQLTAKSSKKYKMFKSAIRMFYLIPKKVNFCLKNRTNMCLLQIHCSKSIIIVLVIMTCHSFIKTS